MQEFAGRPVRAFVVWEPVLVTDWTGPSTATLRRLSDSRAAQFWDKERSISHLLGEHDRRSIVWDRIAVYSPHATWNGEPPQPLYSGGPVTRVIEPARNAVRQALGEIRH